MTPLFMRVLWGAAIGLGVGFVSFEFVFWLVTLLGVYQSMTSMLAQAAGLGAVTGVASGVSAGLRGVGWQRALVEGASALALLFALYGLSLIAHGARLGQPVAYARLFSGGMLVAALAGGLTAAGAAWGLDLLAGPSRVADSVRGR